VSSLPHVGSAEGRPGPSLVLGPGDLGDLFGGPWPALAHRAREFAERERGRLEEEPRDAASEQALFREALSALGREGLLGFTVPAAFAPPTERSRGAGVTETVLAAETNGRSVSPEGSLEQMLRVAAEAPGGGPSARALCLLREILAWHSGLADLAFVMQGLGSFPLALAGSKELKARWLPRVARGEAIAALGITEPGAGSDLGAIALSARRDGDDYVLDGDKTFISNAPLADLVCVFARTAPGGIKGLSAFAVPGDQPGLDREGRIETIAAHPIGSLAFRQVRIPAAWRLGEEGEGASIALATLARFRPTVGASAVGMARRALDEAIRRSKERRQFGKALAEQQGIQTKIADGATDLEAARLLVARAAVALDAGERAVRESSMAKLFATEAAGRIADEAVQIFGGLGVTRGSTVERIYREVRALRIYEGTSEIQRTIIAREVLKADGA